MKSVVIIGAGGLGRQILDIIEACNQEKAQYEILGFIVDPQFGSPGTIIDDKPILGGFDWLEKHTNDVAVICGVGHSHQRYRLIKRADALGCHYFTIVHPSAVLSRRVNLGYGVALATGCMLMNQIQIGNHVVVNLGSTIGHDVKMEDFVTLSLGVNISGNVTLGTGAFVGTGANVIEKITLGDWSIIGAGSTVIRNIPANTTAVGIPAEVIKTRQEGWHLLEDAV